MLARPGGQKEYYDYDNPTLQTDMNNDRGEEGPRMMSSHESLDAGVVRPGMINIIPGDDIIAAPQSPDALLPESQATLPPGDDMEKPSKLKGLFSKKEKKEKEKKEKKEKKDKKDKKDKKKKKDEDVAVAVDEDLERVEPGPDDIEVLEEIALPQAATKSKGPSFGGKLKGLFKGKGGGGDSEPVVVSSPSSEGAGLEAANPAYDSSIPTSPVDSPTGVAADTSMSNYYPPDPAPQTKSRPLTALLRKPKLPPPDPEADPVMELNPVPSSGHIRCSTFLNCVLVLGICLGILFLILNAVHYNPTLAVIGPCFLGLSVFALIGKTFMTLFWQEDPLPRLKPYVQKFEDSLGPKGGVQTVQKQQVIARSSHYGQQYVNYGQPPTQQVAMAAEPQRYGMGYKVTVEPVIIDNAAQRQPTQPTQAPTFI